MTKFASVFLDDVRIDQVYDLIYSDKEFTLYGKTEPTFFAYAQKKSKNFNFVDMKFDAAGPEFYSGDPNVKFTNCPEFSSKFYEYDHPLGNMPFMPKTCHLKENIKLFWISHEEFDFHSTNLTYGVPYSDTFECRALHRVSKKDNGVLVEIYGGVFFTKNTSMKGILKSTTEKGMVEGCNLAAKEIEKAVNIYKGSSTGQ